MNVGLLLQNAFGNINIWQIITGLFAGVLVAKLLDEIFFQLIAKFWPEKYLGYIYTWVEEFDNKYIDSLKEKHPKTAKALEDRICKFLDKVQDIILDKDA